jgi:hypothetical protein
MDPILSSTLGTVVIKQLIIAVASALHLQLSLAVAYISVRFAAMCAPVGSHPGLDATLPECRITATWFLGSLAVSAIVLAVGRLRRN